GRIVEVYGPESSGKTTLALHVVAEAQKLGGVCAFVDAEHALDVGYARKLGVRTDDLLLAQPDCGEQALDIVEMLVKSDAVGVIVVYSLAGARPPSDACEVGRGRRHRCGLRRGPGASGGARGRDGRLAHGPSRAADEP